MELRREFVYSPLFSPWGLNLLLHSLRGGVEFSIIVLRAKLSSDESAALLQGGGKYYSIESADLRI